MATKGLQAGDLRWGDSTQNLTPPFGHVVLQDHVKN